MTASNIDHKIPTYAFWAESNIKTIYPFSGTSRDISTKFTAIGADAFAGTDLEGNIVIPNTVTEVAGFNGTEITGINKINNINYFDGNIEKIGQGCVYKTPSFTGEVVFGEHVATISAMAFYGSGISGELILKGSIANIDNNAFSECTGITSVRVGSNVEEFNTKAAFSKCTNLQNVFFEDGAKVCIGANTFADCNNLEYIYCGDHVVYEGSFNGKCDKNIVLSTSNKLVKPFNMYEQDGGIIYTGAADILDDLASAYLVSKNKLTIASLNGGKLSDQTAYPEKEQLAVPTKRGYIFGGWYSDADFNTPLKGKPETGKTYYAKWDKIADFSMEYGMTKELPTLEGYILSDWKSEDESVVSVEGNQLKAKKVGSTVISVIAENDTSEARAELTISVEVKPMPITMKVKDGNEEDGVIKYQFTGIAPEVTFYRMGNDGAAHNEEVKLNVGEDIVFSYDGGAGRQEYDYLPIVVTNETDGIPVTFKLLNKNYAFGQDGGNPTNEFEKRVIVMATGKTETAINGVESAASNLVLYADGTGQAPILDLTGISASGMDTFTVHFHPWGDTEFSETHLENMPADKLTKEVVSAIAPKNPGKYLMIIDGVGDANYAYQSWIFEIREKQISGGGDYFPPIDPVQKPVIETEEGAIIDLSADGKTAVISVDEGATLKDVILNGKSLGAVTKVENLKTGDKLIIIVETAEEKNSRLIKGVENTTIKMYYKKGEIGKGWIKLRYKKSYGYKVDNYEIFRSAKKNTNFGKQAWFVTKTNKTNGYYKNGKSVKKGTRYYYKMRGVREIAGKTYYTQWSNVVMRTGR